MKQLVIFLSLLFISGCSSSIDSTNDNTEYQMNHFTNVIRIRDLSLSDTASTLRIFYSWHTPAYFTSSNDTYLHARIIDICDNVWYIKLTNEHTFDYKTFNLLNDYADFITLYPEMKQYYKDNKNTW